MSLLTNRLTATPPRDGAAMDTGDISPTAPFVPSAFTLDHRGNPTGPISNRPISNRTDAIVSQGQGFPAGQSQPGDLPAMQESPGKTNLRNQAEFLQQQYDFLLDSYQTLQHKSSTNLEQQQRDFQAAASHYEEMARDIAQVEVAQASAAV